MTRAAQLCAMTVQTIAQRDTTELEEFLAQYLSENAEPQTEAMISKLQAILRGVRNPALTDDPNLDYSDVVELQLFLETLGAK